MIVSIDDSGEMSDGRALRGQAKDAGLYRAVITSINNDNYILDGDNLVLDWQIDKADITGITISNKTVTYNNRSSQRCRYRRQHPIRRRNQCGVYHYSVRRLFLDGQFRFRSPYL